MATENFNPTNGLEFELVQLISGQQTIDEFLKSLMDADLHVLSATEVQQDGTGLRPLLFDRDMGTLLALFTSLERTTAFSQRYPYCLMLTGRQFFGWIPHGLGAVLNPGSTAGFELPPDGVQSIRHEFVLDRK
jgi:hypothetical protein